MSSDVAIRVKSLSKCYQIYSTPQDWLKQSIYPPLQKFIGREAKNYYREFSALTDVSFEIKKGEIVGIIGRNGSGKSTLLQMICGTLNPTAGSIETQGRIAALLELGSGFNPEFSGYENIYMSASILGLSKSEIDAKYEKIVAFADIGDFIHHPVKTYSSGMYVRLAFAVVAHVDADILVIDEALAVGDVFFTQKCMRFLREFAQKGTLLFVSHDTAAVVGLCSKAFLLDSGRLERVGSPRDVSEYYLAVLHKEKMAESQPLAITEDIEITEAVVHEEFSGSENNNNDFGTGAATILHVNVYDASEKPLAFLTGGELLHIDVIFRAKTNFEKPLAGFLVRDRLGQILFGENSSLLDNGPPNANQGQILKVRFSFVMPYLQEGDYSLSVAVGEGNQQNHILHHWVHDAFVFKSLPKVRCLGIFAADIKSIEFSYME